MHKRNTFFLFVFCEMERICLPAGRGCSVETHSVSFTDIIDIGVDEPIQQLRGFR